jgi:hypothetical protein
MEFKERSAQIDVEAEKKVTDLVNELKIKLKDRDMHLSAFIQEKEEKIEEIENLKAHIEELSSKIKKIIEIKQGNCLQEAKDLISWSLGDNQADLFSRPIQWIYMPLYAIFVEDKNTKQEDIKLLFPGFINRDSSTIYTDLSEAMAQIRKLLTNKIEMEIALRSNFEFSCENKNIIKESNFHKMIQTGISILRSKGIVTPEIENTIRMNLNLI